MTATTEINVKEFIKTVKKNSEQGDNSEFSERIMALIDKFENEVAQYFNANNKDSFEEAFTDLFDLIYKIRVLSVSLLVNYKEYLDTITNEDFINNGIIDIFQNKSRESENLSLSFINTLEMSRDKEMYALFTKIPLNEFNSIYHSSILSDEIERNKEYHKTINNNLDDNTKKEMDRFKDFFFNALSLDFTAVLYYLLEEKKIVFGEKKLNELSIFNKKALESYKGKYDSFDRFINEENLAIHVNKHVQTLNDFIVSKSSNHLLVTELNSVIQDIINLKDLEQGWDEEDSVPVKHSFIIEAIDFISNIYMLYEKVPSFIAPTAYSGILLEYNYDNSRLDIRIGDEKSPIINNFQNKKLVDKRVPFNYDFLNSLWKTRQTA